MYTCLHCLIYPSISLPLLFFCPLSCLVLSCLILSVFCSSLFPSILLLLPFSLSSPLQTEFLGYQHPCRSASPLRRFFHKFSSLLFLEESSLSFSTDNYISSSTFNIVIVFTVRRICRYVLTGHLLIIFL